ncbi:Gfo/Idh/MocA family protein [Salipaludibacillus daqingensis]|uniref:Gfo/Idh/MocA family protein n=1 Tax=Salipaludibacillus daqingensis TaxID=3041001 RepID=UPI0024740591|nr:Gfo/Idh/MocA family oxidoreductase [Salipaludibacillus daqingensis]
MTNVVRWGILSSANIAKKSMVPAIHDADNAELVAVASKSGKAKQTAEEWGAKKSYDTYEDLLNDPEIDAVYIPLPNSLHKTWVIEAAKHKKHVLVEKPAGITSEEVLEMGGAARQNSVIWMEGFMYQFHPQHQYVKKLISEGSIGDIKKIRSSFSFPLDLTSDNIRLRQNLGGGSLYDVGCYCVHVSRFILEEEPLKVFSSARKLNDSSVDISASAILTFANADAIIDCSFEEANVNRYEVVGTKGTIEVPYAFRPDKNPNGGKGEVTLKNSIGDILDHQEFDANQFTIQIQHFSQCVLNGVEPTYTAESTYNNMKVIEAMYQSQG